MKKSEMLDLLKRLARGIADMFGQSCEVVIHDLEQPGNAIAEIYNGHVTGRKVGDSLSDLGLKRMRQGQIGEDLINYDALTNNGRMIKCSSFFVSGKGYSFAFCLNFDYTSLSLAGGAIESLIKTRDHIDERYFRHPGEKVLDEMFDEAIRQVGIPVALMKKEDRLKVIKNLDERGAFLMQRGIQQIADKLNISRFTIYNYLKELGIKQ
jgi:predicted transcriptional regulator YheO